MKAKQLIKNIISGSCVNSENEWRRRDQKSNAPAYNVTAVKQFLADERIPLLEHPPYSPD